MKRVKLFLLFLLIIAAGLSAYIAMKPLVYSVQKTQQMKKDSQTFYEEAEVIQKEAEEQHIPIPHEDLFLAMREYNRQLYATRQVSLNGREAYQASGFDLTAYGLEDQVFGVITIPKMELEMPLYLGASDENMSNGAAVLAQTSIPIGGDSTNAVIAGHRGWSGYKYFMDIELLELGDEVTITNLWGTLTYQVVDIQIVSPDDVDAILIQQGRDMITLLTCHPPNTGGRYRYLVFCERVKD